MLCVAAVQVQCNAQVQQNLVNVNADLAVVARLGPKKPNLCWFLSFC
jgi:hypothetical protein